MKLKRFIARKKSISIDKHKLKSQYKALAYFFSYNRNCFRKKIKYILNSCNINPHIHYWSIQGATLFEIGRWSSNSFVEKCCLTTAISNSAGRKLYKKLILFHVYKIRLIGFRCKLMGLWQMEKIKWSAATIRTNTHAKRSEALITIFK